MADKLRSVNTKFWDDPFIEELSPSEKLLFLYLLTNPQTNLMGIYELTIKRISFDTSLNKETIQNGLERFAKASKVFYIDNFIILPNWLKNQRLNANMKKAVTKDFDRLPKDIRINILGNGSESLGNGSEWFEIIRERLGKYEIEIEDEIEDEIEIGKVDENVFDSFKEKYPGRKRGCKTELDNLKKKHKDWVHVIPLLNDAIDVQIKYRQIQKGKGAFVPEWKNLQTWINQRCWEEEVIMPKQQDRLQL